MIKRELFNIEAEQAILGTIILNNEYLNRVVEFLRVEDFYEPAHQKIYTQILHNVEKVNTVANQVTLKQFFESDASVKANGGALYLSTLLSAASAIIDIADYGRIIHDFALERKLVMLAEDAVIQIHSGEKNIPVSERIEGIESELFKLSDYSPGSDFKNVSHSVHSTLEKTKIASKRDSHVSGISTGLLDLDKILGGLQSSDLIILAARPSMGKTALALNIAVNACETLNKGSSVKKSVGFFSLEMSSDQLASRILSMESSVNSAKLRSGKLNSTEWEALKESGPKVSALPLFIDDTPALSISAIRTRTRRLIRKHNLSLLIVDYLQLLRGSFKRSNDNRVQEVSEITQGLKAIAKEFDIPVIALSQLSRKVEDREDKKPHLSDLRESGSIEQDADVVAFIYREAYYEERKAEPDMDKMKKIRDLAEVIIAKQRNGPVGSINLHFDAEFTRFANSD